MSREYSGSLKTYALGYGLSLVLTIAAFFLVQTHRDVGIGFLSPSILIALLMVFAIEQLIVQMVCFLHLDQEPRPRSRLMAAVLASFFVIAVVAGSLWIMGHLNNNMMPSHAVDTYMLDQ